MKIEIGLEVYKGLTNRLQHEHDTLNDVIARLLDGQDAQATAPAMPPVEMATWIGHKVSLPVGTELRKTLKGVEHVAIVQKDGLKVGGQLFPSLSAGAIHVAKHNVNGWRFWRVYDSLSDKWRTMESLRDES